MLRANRFEWKLVCENTVLIPQLQTLFSLSSVTSHSVLCVCFFLFLSWWVGQYAGQLDEWKEHLRGNNHDENYIFIGLIRKLRFFYSADQVTIISVFFLFIWKYFSLLVIHKRIQHTHSLFLSIYRNVATPLVFHQFKCRIFKWARDRNWCAWVYLKEKKKNTFIATKERTNVQINGGFLSLSMWAWHALKFQFRPHRRSAQAHYNCIHTFFFLHLISASPLNERKNGRKRNRTEPSERRKKFNWIYHSVMSLSFLWLRYTTDQNQRRTNETKRIENIVNRYCWLIKGL